MFFYIQKFVGALLLPLSIALILFFIGLIYLFLSDYFKAKIYLVLSLVWIFTFSLTPVSDALLEPLENSYPKLENVDKDIKYVLVLGSGHKTNEQLPLTSWLSPTAINRLAEGIRIYNKLEKNSKLIVSGFGGNDKNSHAILQKKLAIEFGIKEEDIITFPKPKTTYEEAKRTKEFLNNEKIVLVTSAYHMKRAIGLFKKAGVDVIAAPTNHFVKNSSNIISRPNASSLLKAEKAFHEYLGLAYAKLRGRID